MRHDFDVQRDHGELITASTQLLTADGVLYFSTNRRGFRLDATALTDFKVEDISRATLPEDFHSRPNTHTAFRITRN